MLFIQLHRTAPTPPVGPTGPSLCHTGPTLMCPTATATAPVGPTVVLVCSTVLAVVVDV